MDKLSKFRQIVNAGGYTEKFVVYKGPSPLEILEKVYPAVKNLPGVDYASFDKREGAIRLSVNHTDFTDILIRIRPSGTTWVGVQILVSSISNNIHWEPKYYNPFQGLEWGTRLDRGAWTSDNWSLEEVSKMVDNIQRNLPVGLISAVKKILK
jgi:hypothetical protein